MGARPVALLDPLRFGPLDDPRNRYLFSGVVAGIGQYGNCIGVPTVGGEVKFADRYGPNPSVNVMCIGFAPADRLLGASPEATAASLSSSAPARAATASAVFRSWHPGRWTRMPTPHVPASRSVTPSPRSS